MQYYIFWVCVCVCVYVCVCVCVVLVTSYETHMRRIMLSLVVYFALPQFWPLSHKGMVQMAIPSKVWVCGRSPAAIEGSNPTGGMDVCLL